MTVFTDFFSTYVDATAEMIFMFHFFTKCLLTKIKPTHYFVYAIISTVILFLFKDQRLFQYLLCAAILTAAGIFIYRANYMRVILYSAAAITAMQLCYGVIGSLSGIIFPLIPADENGITSLAFAVGGNAISLSLSVLCYHIILKYFALDKTINEQCNILILLIPALTILFAGQYINFAVYGNFTVTSESNFFEKKHFFMLIIQLLGIGSLFCIMFVYKKILGNVRINTKILLLEQETGYLRQYVSEAKDCYEKTSSFRHDIKNHMEIIRNLILKGDTEKALLYMADIEEIEMDITMTCHTNNPVTDILLENKLSLAKNFGINSSCSLSLPHPCKISDMDFCIILSNAVDNAINACRLLGKDADAFINVSGNIQGDFLLIEVRNSFQNNSEIKEGIGLKNISTVAEKYNGCANIEILKDEFILSVLLVC